MIPAYGRDNLVASIPGQEDLELLPKRGTTFDIKVLAGASASNSKKTRGKSLKPSSIQPDTVIVLANLFRCNTYKNCGERCISPKFRFLGWSDARSDPRRGLRDAQTFGRVFGHCHPSHRQ
jgi:hypothetical protein